VPDDGYFVRGAGGVPETLGARPGAGGRRRRAVTALWSRGRLTASCVPCCVLTVTLCAVLRTVERFGLSLEVIWQGKGRDAKHAHAHPPRRVFIVPLALGTTTRSLMRAASCTNALSATVTPVHDSLSVRRTLERRITYLCAISVATVTRTLHPHPLPFHMVHAPDPSWRPAAATSIRCRCSSPAKRLAKMAQSDWPTCAPARLRSWPSRRLGP